MKGWTTGRLSAAKGLGSSGIFGPCTGSQRSGWKALGRWKLVGER